MDKNLIVNIVLIGGMILLFLGLPVGALLAFASVAGLFLITGSIQASTSLLLATSFDVASSVGYVVIPMFIFMGALAARSGIVNDLYDAAYKSIGHIPGGLAVATCFASAAFGAVTGSSISSAAAMTKVALPEMLKYGYSVRLSTGIIAVAGTFAMMLPPSLIMVFYGIIAQQSIGKLLVAGILPGILTAVVFAILIVIRATINPSIAPPGPRFPFREKLRSSVKASPFVLVLVVLVGGILSGFWTATEASAGGVFVVAAIGFLKRSMTMEKIFGATIDSVVTSAAVLILVIGSILFGKFLALTGVTFQLTNYINNANLSSFELFLVLLVFYLILGTVLEGISILALTVPIVLPIIIKAGWDPIWFGVFLVKLVEISAVSPPVGLNLFAVKSVAPEIKSTDIDLGALQFWICDIFILFLLFFVPSIATILPDMM